MEEKAILINMKPPGFMIIWVGSFWTLVRNLWVEYFQNLNGRSYYGRVPSTKGVDWLVDFTKTDIFFKRKLVSKPMRRPFSTIYTLGKEVV